MVLQVSNYSKRIDSENTPPAQKPITSKSHVSNLRSSIHSASRRRRARTTGSTHSPRYAVEQAKRRSTTKTPPASVKFELRTPPPAIEPKDVEMKDAEPVKGHGVPTTSVSLPRYLVRPDYREIPSETIKAIDADLAESTVDYIQGGLEELGPGMMQVLSGVRADPVKTSLPKELSIIVNDLSSEMPSHMLALYSRQPVSPTSTRRRVTLFPTHNIILAMHCAHLPQLPASPLIPIPETAGSQITIPVVPLCIPSPETFPQLSAFLYTKRFDHLLASLLPCPPPPTLSEGESSQDTMILQFAQKLAATYTTHALLQHAMTVNGLWRNVCALGVFDDRLWGAMDLAWEVLLRAMAIGTGNPEAVL